MFSFDCPRDSAAVGRNRFETRVSYTWVCYTHVPLGIKGLLIFPSFHATFFPPPLSSALHCAEIVTSFHSISSARHRHPANPCQPFFSVCLSLSVDPGGGSLLISVERPQDSFRARNKAFTRSRCVTRLMKSYPSSPPQLTVARGGATKRARFNQPTFASINCNRLFFA